MFITKAIVEAHGGNMLCFNNSERKGAKFRFTIPLADSPILNCSNLCDYGPLPIRSVNFPKHKRQRSHLGLSPGIRLLSYPLRKEMAKREN